MLDVREWLWQLVTPETGWRSERVGFTREVVLAYEACVIELHALGVPESVLEIESGGLMMRVREEWQLGLFEGTRPAGPRKFGRDLAGRLHREMWVWSRYGR